MSESVESVTLSKTETDLAEFCERTARASPFSRVPLARILDHFYGDKERPKHAPSAMARRLRILQLKTVALGIPGPRRVSPLGRGHPAVYVWGTHPRR